MPQEVIKQRLVTGVYSSFREAVRNIYKTEGVRGFYSSWLPTMSRNVPFVVTTFTSRDVLRNQILKRKQQKEKVQVALTHVENVGLGIFSALIAGVVTQPVDVVSTYYAFVMRLNLVNCITTETNLYQFCCRSKLE